MAVAFRVSKVNEEFVVSLRVYLATGFEELCRARYGGKLPIDVLSSVHFTQYQQAKRDTAAFGWQQLMHVFEAHDKIVRQRKTREEKRITRQVKNKR